MDAEAIRTELKVSEDRRVRAGLRGAIETIPGRHGMTPGEQREFANEVERECSKVAAGNSEAGACCEVVIEERENQIEVKVRAAAGDAQGDSGKRALGRNAGHLAGGENLRRHRAADREGDNGHFVARLVRHVDKKPAHS